MSRALIGGLLLLGLASPAASLPLTADEQLALASDAELDEIRGGFVTESGFQISFGIEKGTFVNGLLQASTALRIPQFDLASLRGGAVDAAVLNGLAPELTTIVQNNLDRATIQTLTLINANVIGIDAIRATALGALLNQQLIQRLR